MTERSIHDEINSWRSQFISSLGKVADSCRREDLPPLKGEVDFAEQKTEGLSFSLLCFNDNSMW